MNKSIHQTLDLIIQELQSTMERSKHCNQEDVNSLDIEEYQIVIKAMTQNIVERVLREQNQSFMA